MSALRSLTQFLLKNPQTTPLGFEQWLIDAAKNALKYDQGEAERYARSRRQRLWTDFQKFDQDLRLKGCASAFSPIDQRSQIFITPLPDSHSLAAYLVYTDRHHVLEWLSQLTNRQYEYLGAATMHFLGASYSEVTPPGNDASVDFYSLLPTWGSSGMFHSPHKFSKIVGQSKNHATPVGVNVMKELDLTFQEIRSFTVGMSTRLPPWFKNHKGPVVGVVISPYGFESGAVSRAHNSGIILADNIDVAETIITSRRYKVFRTQGLSPRDALSSGMLAVGCVV